MADLIKKIDEYNIFYYNVFPIVTDIDEAKKNKIIPNYSALVYNNNHDDITIDKMKEISSQIQNIPVMFTHSDKDDSYKYRIDFYFNGYKIKLFSFSIFPLLRYLYDNSVLRTSLELKIGDVTLKGSSRPDEDMNFFIRYKIPKIDELNYSLFEILTCLGLHADNLDPHFSICQMESDLIDIIPLPVKNKRNFSVIKPQANNILGLRRNHKDLPSLYAYVVGDDGKSIQSRFFSTHSIIMEMASTPIEASLLHYFLMKIDKNLKFDVIRHYQGEKIDRPTRIITKIKGSQPNEIELMSGGEVFSI